MIVSVNDVPLGTQGNLLCITGGEGTGKVTMWRRWLPVLSVPPERMWMRWALRSTKTAGTRRYCSMTRNRAKYSCMGISATCCGDADVRRCRNGSRRIVLREWAGRTPAFHYPELGQKLPLSIRRCSSGGDRRDCGFDKMRQRWSGEHSRRGRTVPAGRYLQDDVSLRYCILSQRAEAGDAGSGCSGRLRRSFP